MSHLEIWMLLHLKTIKVMANRSNDYENQLTKKLNKKLKKKYKDPQWCLPYFTDNQAETPRFQIAEPKIQSPLAAQQNSPRLLNINDDLSRKSKPT